MRRKTLVFALVTTHFESSGPTAQILVKNSTRRPAEYGSLYEPGVSMVELPSIVLELESTTQNQPQAPVHCLTRSFQELFDQYCPRPYGYVVTLAGPVRHCHTPPSWRKEGWHHQSLVVPIETLTDNFATTYRWLPWPWLKAQKTHRFPNKTGEAQSLLDAIEAHLQSHQSITS